MGISNDKELRMPEHYGANIGRNREYYQPAIRCCRTANRAMKKPALVFGN